mgnify:CR=1 FL=1
MDSKLRQKAVELRLKSELSYSEIKKRLNVPKSTLSYWLHDFPLNEKKIIELRQKGWTKGEAGREKFRLAMHKKKEEKAQEIYNKQKIKLRNISKDAHFVAGLMLYLAEGDKRNYSRIALGNTDSRVIKFFIKWMIKFLGIPKNKIKAQLHLYENMNIEKEKEFWQNELELQEAQFYKSSIRKLKKSSFSYQESYRHGTCEIYLMGVEKKTELMMAIKAFMDKYLK